MSMPGNEVITTAAIVGPMAAILWFFFRRWIERMERIETKIDAIIESRGQLISREEYDRGIARVHARMDEHVAEEVEFATRIARLEGQAR